MRRLFLVLALIFALAVPASAATPSFRSAGTRVESTTTTTLVVNYTLTAGDLLCITFNAGAAVSPTVSSVVWSVDSSSLTLVKKQTTSTGFRSNWVYCKQGAAAGAGTVTATFGLANVAAGVAFGYQNVDCTTPWDTGTPGGNFDTNSSPTVTMPTGDAGDLVITTFLTTEAYVSYTAVNGTERDEQSSANTGLVITDQPITGGAATTNGTLGASDTWAGVSFTANQGSGCSSGGGRAPGSLQLLGVGN